MQPGGSRPAAVGGVRRKANGRIGRLNGRSDVASCLETVGLDIALAQPLEVVEGAAEDLDDLMNFVPVKAELAVMFAALVNRLVVLEAVTLETEPFFELFDLRAEDERYVFLSEVALTLRAVDRVVGCRIDDVDDELPLAGGTLEYLG
jgi:hypothetical protein